MLKRKCKSALREIYFSKINLANYINSFFNYTNKLKFLINFTNIIPYKILENIKNVRAQRG